MHLSATVTALPVGMQLTRLDGFQGDGVLTDRDIRGMVFTPAHAIFPTLCRGLISITMAVLHIDLQCAICRCFVSLHTQLCWTHYHERLCECRWQTLPDCNWEHVDRQHFPAGIGQPERIIACPTETTIDATLNASTIPLT